MRDEVCGSCKYYDENQNGFCSKLSAMVEPEEYGCKNWILYGDGLWDEMHEADERLLNSDWGEMEVQE